MSEEYAPEDFKNIDGLFTQMPVKQIANLSFVPMSAQVLYKRRNSLGIPVYRKEKNKPLSNSQVRELMKSWGRP